MRRWTNEVIVGAAILIALAIGIYGYIYLREIPVRRQGYNISVLFDNVTGLQSGDAITVAGLKVGRVRQMQLSNSHVAVKVWMSGDVPFPADSRAAIKSIGMIGEKYIDLIPGTSQEALQDGDVVVGTYITDLADAGGSLSDLMSQATSLLAKLNVAMDTTLNQHAPNSLAGTLANAHQISAQLNRSLADNMSHIESSINNLDMLSASMNGYWQQHRGELDTASTNVAQSFSQLPRLVAKMDSALTTTRQLLRTVENREGTVGKALHDDELYVKANSTIDEMQSLLSDMKKNPGKYLQISMIRLF